MSKQFSVVLYEGSIHAVEGATARHTGGIGQAAGGFGPAAIHPGVRQRAAIEGVTFIEQPDGSHVNAEPVVVKIGQYGEPRRNVGGWAVFARHGEADAPIHAAPFQPPRSVDQGGHVLEIAAGELVIPASV